MNCLSLKEGTGYGEGKKVTLAQFPGVGGKEGIARGRGK